MATLKTPTAPCTFAGLSELSDEDLLTSTRNLVGRSNQLLAAFLAYLGEVEARGLYRLRSCASVYTFCVYELRMPEDTAFRRARAARIARRFPIVLEKIAAGEIHLTGLLMLGPHLTEENHLQVLARAKHRTKKEIARLVRILDPLPDVPAVVEPLGPGRQALVVPMNASWSQLTASLCGPVRELDAGDRPKDWIHADVQIASSDDVTAEAPEAAFPGKATAAADSRVESESRLDLHSNSNVDLHSGSALEPNSDAESPLGQQRYKVQFTATEQYVDLLEEARDLLAHAVPSRSLEEVHWRAMRLLVDELKRRKYAVTGRSRSQHNGKSGGKGEPRHEHAGQEQENVARSVRSEVNADGPNAGPGEDAIKNEGGQESEQRVVGATVEVPAINGSESEPRWRGTDRNVGQSEHVVEKHTAADAHEHGATGGSAKAALAEPRQSGRYLPATVRRAVWARDEGRCTYVDARGQRCRETSLLELHHREPYARRGPPTVSNLCLRCRAHNALAAEEDFGGGFMAHRKNMNATKPNDPFGHLY